MTEKEARQLKAEQFVEKVLTETFKQKVSAKTVKAVAAKVSKTIPLAQGPARHVEAAE
ncbi:DegV family EDD domain-containing protein [Mesorhizobium loti]|nr:DegV family EDD domain-containing protein [Mesorhizobium loti]